MANPAPPTALSATYTTEPTDRNRRLIKLAWTASVAPGLVRYNVYRNDQLVSTVLPAATQYLDPTPGGDVDFFTYYMSSVDGVGEGPVSVSITNFSQKTESYLYFLRECLKDNPPDPRVQRWTDCELLLALKMAVSRVNAIPMTTYYNLDTFPNDFFSYIIVAARLAALRAQASLEAAKEFTMGVGAVNININRSGLYGNLISQEETAWQKEMENVKRYMTMRTVHGEGLLSSTLPFRIRTYAPRQYRVR